MTQAISHWSHEGDPVHLKVSLLGICGLQSGIWIGVGRDGVPVTRYGPGGPGGDEIFRTRPDWSWDLPSLVQRE